MYMYTVLPENRTLKKYFKMSSGTIVIGGELKNDTNSGT